MKKRFKSFNITALEKPAYAKMAVVVAQEYIVGMVEEGKSNEEIYAVFGAVFKVEGSSHIIRAVNRVVNSYYKQFPPGV